MGALEERVKLSKMVHGKNLPDYYKNNTLELYQMYQKSDDMVKNIDKKDIQVGAFYHLHYLDDSNWMKYSPIFCVDHRVFSNLIIIMGVNFNFIPLELRSALLDPYITEKDFDNNQILKVNFKGIYSALMRYGFEYSLVEYNVAQIKLVHRIDLEFLPRFLYSSYPTNKYDPVKLMDIWKKKIDGKQQRHQEIVQTMLSDFYDISGEISDRYSALEGHVKRLQKNFEKYGRP